MAGTERELQRRSRSALVYPVCTADNNACEMQGCRMKKWCIGSGCSVHSGGAGGSSGGWWVGRAEAEEGWLLMIEQVSIHELEDGRLC